MGLIGLIAGFVLIFIIYNGYDYLNKKRLKNKIPKDSLLLAKPEKKQISQKEVEEIDRQRITKFREFEKLRRFGSSTTEVSSGVIQRTGELSERSTVPIKSSKFDTGTNPDNVTDYTRQNGRNPKTNKSVKLHRPTSI